MSAGQVDMVIRRGERVKGECVIFCLCMKFLFFGDI